LTAPREQIPSAPAEAGRSNALREEYGVLAAKSHETGPHEPTAGAPTPERAALSDALREEYNVLAAMLASVWSASLFRVSLLLGVVSAIGVALGFAAQAGGGFGSTFMVFALVALPLALFLGLATFARSVELQREAYVYITGMNRIRHAMVDAVPASRPYLVLSIYDDALGVYRSQGTGIRLRAPRRRLVFALVQTNGIVAVICAALAGIIGRIATDSFASPVAWGITALAFVVTLAALLTYWNRSIAQLQKAIRPMFPTPKEAMDAPI
jgi:hypothetical protein